MNIKEFVEEYGRKDDYLTKIGIEIFRAEFEKHFSEKSEQDCIEDYDYDMKKAYDEIFKKTKLSLERYIYCYLEETALRLEFTTKELDLKSTLVKSFVSFSLNQLKRAGYYFNGNACYLLDDFYEDFISMKKTDDVF